MSDDQSIRIEVDSTIVVRRMRVEGRAWRWRWLIARGEHVIEEGECGKWIPAWWKIDRAVRKHFPKNGTF